MIQPHALTRHRKDECKRRAKSREEIAVPPKVWAIMQSRVADTENYSVEWTNQELLQATVTRNKKQGQETGAQVDIKKLKVRSNVNIARVDLCRL